MGAKSLPSLCAHPSLSKLLRHQTATYDFGLSQVVDATKLWHCARAFGGLATLWRVELVLPPGTAVAKFSAASCTVVAEGRGIFGFAAAELEAVVPVIWRQLGGQRRGQQERVQVPLDLGPL